MIYFSFFSYLFAIVAIARAQLSFSPAVPYCDGDTVTFTCILEPAGNPFIITRASIRFVNDSNTCYTRAAINDNNTPPINSTRYTHLSIVSVIVSPNASAVLEINPFQAKDASIPFSCCVETNDTVFISNSIYPTPLADPPSKATININTTYNSDINCPITLYWQEVIADRNVSSYEVLLNGTNIATLSPTAGTNTYTTSNMSLVTKSGNYTVRAVSCAGSSVSNEVVFTPPDPPSSFLFTHVFTNLFNCEASLSISAPTIISDRPLTHYSLFINNKLEHTLPANGNDYSFSGTISLNQISVSITVTAYSCAGATSYSAFETSSCVPNSRLTTPAIIGIAVGGLCFICIILALILLCCIGIYIFIKKSAREKR